MKELNDGGPAFPTTETDAPHLNARPGMSLRDWFAGHAMQSMLHSEIGKSGWATVHGVASDAYKVADAMLKAREVKP